MTDPAPDRFHIPRRFVLPLALAALAIAALLVAPFVARAILPAFTETDVQTTVVSTIQSESPEAFLVTGTLRSAVTTSTRSATTLLPGFLNIEVGNGEVEVRVPGRIAYGIDTREITAGDVRLLESEDGAPVVQVRLPPLAVFSVEPLLEEAAIRAEVGGWIKPSRDAEREALRSALGRLRPTLRQQGETHLRDNVQPSRNTAEAVVAQLSGPLAALGLESPVFRFVMPDGETLTITPYAPADRVIVAPPSE